MNAFSAEFHRELRGDLQQRAHRAAISIHCPNQSEIGLAARVDLAILRDDAVRSMGHASEDAAQMLAVVMRTAAVSVYADLPDARLLALRSALGLAVEAARAVEIAQRG